jgi:putative PEP-CTERM system TPR-repeat lipoprotein
VKTISRLTLLACVLVLPGCDWFVSSEEHVARAEKFYAAGEDRSAAIELQNALGSKPADSHARLLLARVSLRQGDVQAAARELQTAVQGHAPAAEVANIGAEIQLAKGDYAGLLAKLESGNGDLDATSAAIYRGFALLAMQKADAAIAAFNSALALSPDSARARLGLADALARPGGFDAALAEIEKVLKATPGDAHAWALKGRILGQRGEYRNASSAFTEARKHAAGQFTAFEYSTLLAALVEASLATGDVKVARSALGALAERAPDVPLVHLLSARIAMAEQNYSLAVTEAQKVVTAAPTHPMGKLVLGAALLANGNLHQAEAQLAELVKLAPENNEARKLLADTYLRLQRPEVAMQVLAPTRQSGTADPQVEAMLGWANLQRGDEAVAIDLLRKSTAAQPNEEGLKLDLAFAYLRAGRHQEAIDLLNSLPARAGNVRRERLLVVAIAASKSPQVAQVEVEKILKAHVRDVEVLNIAASFYAQIRNFTRARELLRSAVAIDPGNAGSLLSLARVEIAAGDDAAARAALQSVLAIDASNKVARVTLAQIALRDNDAKTATEQLEAARQADAKAIEPRLLLAAQYLRERKTAQADVILRELEALSENDPALTVVTGRLYTQAGRYDEALSQFREAVRRDSRNPSWLLEVARVLNARGDQAGARESIQKALELDPVNVAANGLMIGLELKDGSKESVRARMARVRKAHPDDASAAMLEGDVNLALRDAGAAARAFADSYRLQPSSAAAIRTYEARTAGHLPAASALLIEWLQREPRDHAARRVFAQSLMEQGAQAEAIAQYEQVVAGGRPGAMVLNNLAWLYQQAGDSRAEATARKAHEMAPEVGAIADTYGWILVEAGRAAEALPILERAMRDKGAGPEVRFHYGVALAKGGQQEKGRETLRKLLEDPGFTQASEARKVLAELGE